MRRRLCAGSSNGPATFVERLGWVLLALLVVALLYRASIQGS